MQIHTFYKTNFSTRAHAQPPFTAHGCDSFAVYQSCHPGKFIEQPEGYEACQPGFKFYRKDSGAIVGLKLD